MIQVENPLMKKLCQTNSSAELEYMDIESNDIKNEELCCKNE